MKNFILTLSFLMGSTAMSASINLENALKDSYQEVDAKVQEFKKNMNNDMHESKNFDQESKAEVGTKQVQLQVSSGLN